MSSTSRRRSSRKKRTLKSPFQQHLLQGTDFGILSVLFLVPLFLGGRMGAGQFTLFVTAGAMALCWLVYQSLDETPRYRVTRFEPILLLTLILLWLQCTNLPGDWIERISPKSAEVLTLWQGSGTTTSYDLGSWTSISLMPAATRQGLFFLIAYGLIFVVVSQRLAHVEDIEKLFRWMALAALGMAALGLAQYFFSNGKFLWSYQHPTISTDGSAIGSFTNGNHFAHFLMLGSGPLLWWFMTESVVGSEQSGRRSTRQQFQREGNRPLLAFILLGGLGLVIFAVLMGLTRGGAVALGISLSVCLFICWLRGYVSARLLGGLLGGGGLAAGALLLYGLDQVSDNLNDWEVDRWLIWDANVRIAKDYPILGTGLGSHFHSYRSYLNTPLFESRFSHAESGYLQILSETGLVGFCLLGVALLFPLYWCLYGLRYAKNRQEVILFAAMLGSFIANYLHSVVDFVWWVPACLTMLLIQAACACRLYQITRRRRLSRDGSEPAMTCPRVLVWATMVVVALMSGWMAKEAWAVWQGEKYYQEFQRIALIDSETDDSMGEAEESVSASYASATGSHIGFTEEQLREYAHRKLVEQVNLLIQASRLNPHDADLRFKVAEGYLVYFEILQTHGENPMSTAQIQDTVYASEFETAEAMHEWLNRAFGNNIQFLYAAHQHAKAAVQLCPLQGDAYLLLSQLTFLDGAGPEAVEEALRQAELVRPYDADVQFARGKFEWNQHRYDDALEHWKRAFHQEIRTQKRIIRLVSPAIPPAKFIEIFEPDWLALRRMVKQYRINGDPDALNQILPLYAKQAIIEADREDNSDPIRTWMQAVVSFRELDQPENAEQCVLAALKRHPGNYELRETYAKLLYSMNRMEEAEREIRWCLTYNPDDVGLRQRYEKTQSKRLKSLSQIQLTSGQEEPPAQ